MPDSFYGGKPGYSFVLVTNYLSIAEMVENFQQGPDYTAVHFDEHVLINTENKNDPDNGKIYRRGYDYHNDLGGAIYVGTIVGPAGRAPMLELTTIENVQSKQAAEGYDYRYSEGEYAPFDNLVPGKEEDGTYNDSIKWAACCVRNENNEDSTAWIGFLFPYLVVDYTADSVSPYYNRDNDTDVFTNTDLVDRVDDKQHPYYEEWHISIPKGIKGESLNNFRYMQADSTIESYDGQDDDIENKRKVLVYDYYNYDADEGGNPVTLYLGDYNMIKDVVLSEDGTLTVSYEHDDDSVFDRAIKWIKYITLDTDTGLFTVVYNHDQDANGNDTEYQTYLSWVSGIEIEEDGTVNIKYITGDEVSLSTIVRWVEDMYIETADVTTEEGTGDQKVHVKYNTGEEEAIGAPLNYIMGMTMVQDNYHLLVWYSDPAKRQQLIDEGLSYSYKDRDGWYDLGPVKDESGILIGMNISTDDYPQLGDIPTALAYLNDYFPEGLQGTDLHGKCVVIGKEQENKRFYAFDYNLIADRYVGWFYVGSLTNDPSYTILLAAEDDNDLIDKLNKLDPNGIWFILED